MTHIFSNYFYIFNEHSILNPTNSLKWALYGSYIGYQEDINVCGNMHCYINTKLKSS